MCGVFPLSSMWITNCPSLPCFAVLNLLLRVVLLSFSSPWGYFPLPAPVPSSLTATTLWEVLVFGEATFLVWSFSELLLFFMCPSLFCINFKISLSKVTRQWIEETHTLRRLSWFVSALTAVTVLSTKDMPDMLKVLYTLTHLNLPTTLWGRY